MKRLFTIVAFVALSVSAMAQQIPNGGFETWTNTLAPASWGTIASAFQSTGYAYFVTKDTAAANHVQGLAAVKIMTDTVTAGTFTTISGILGLGTANYIQGQGIAFSGVPYTKRVDSIYMSIKYAPARVVDTAFMDFDLLHTGTSLFGGGLGLPITSTAGQWQGIVIPLHAGTTTYYTNTTQHPDTLYMDFYSSGTDSASMGTTLWVDNIHFDAAVNTSTGIADLNGKVLGVNAYPNPANNAVTVAVETDEVGSQIILTDLTGREVYNSTISSDKFTIDTRSFESGVYSIRVNSIDKMTTYKGKLTITH